MSVRPDNPVHRKQDHTHFFRMFPVLFSFSFRKFLLIHSLIAATHYLGHWALRIQLWESTACRLQTAKVLGRCHGPCHGQCLMIQICVLWLSCNFLPVMHDLNQLRAATETPAQECWGRHRSRRMRIFFFFFPTAFTGFRNYKKKKKSVAPEVCFEVWLNMTKYVHVCSLCCV